MPTPFSPQRAAALGAFVKAAYAMYEADKANPTPAPAEIPAGYDFVAWVTMRDFFINSGPPVFYGLIAEHRSASRDFVLAIRGTSSLLEWWDNFHFGLSNFAPGGRVSAGFLAIYQTLNVLEHSAADGTASDAGLVGLSFADQVQEVVRRRAAPGGVSADSLMLTNVSVTGHSRVPPSQPSTSCRIRRTVRSRIRRSAPSPARAWVTARSSRRSTACI